MKKRKILVSLLTAVALIALMAVPAMAAEEVSKAATVTVSEYISFTVTDYGDAGINFGTLDPGTSDNPEAAQNGAGAVQLKVGAETNVNCNINTKGSGDFDDGGGHSFALGNAKWDIDSAVAGATAMTTTYALITTSTAGSEKTQEVWHWLTIPAAQYAASYNTTFYYQAIK